METARAAQRSAPPTRSAPDQTPSTASHFRRLAEETWKSLASMPSANSASRGAHAEPSPHPSRLLSLGFDGGSAAWWSLVIAALLAMALVAFSRRFRPAAAGGSAESRWAKAMLRTEIRTREDVIRAFHGFALHRPDPARDWWTHQDVAQHFGELTPEVRDEIQDLSSLYEQARYLPPEVQLSSEQIDRVQAALRRCGTCS
jgi:hypothetical protein